MSSLLQQEQTSYVHGLLDEQITRLSSQSIAKQLHQLDKESSKLWAGQWASKRSMDEADSAASSRSSPLPSRSLSSGFVTNPLPFSVDDQRDGFPQRNIYSPPNTRTTNTTTHRSGSRVGHTPVNENFNFARQPPSQQKSYQQQYSTPTTTNTNKLNTDNFNSHLHTSNISTDFHPSNIPSNFHHHLNTSSTSTTTPQFHYPPHPSYASHSQSQSQQDDIHYPSRASNINNSIYSSFDSNPPLSSSSYSHHFEPTYPSPSPSRHHQNYSHSHSSQSHFIPPNEYSQPSQPDNFEHFQHDNYQQHHHQQQQQNKYNREYEHAPKNPPQTQKPFYYLERLDQPLDGDTEDDSYLNTSNYYNSTTTPVHSRRGSLKTYPDASLTDSIGSPMGRLARAERTSRQLKITNAHLQQQVTNLTRENETLKQKMSSLELSAKKLVAVQRECEALKMSFKHSEEVRKQQKELILILQNNNKQSQNNFHTNNKSRTSSSSSFVPSRHAAIRHAHSKFTL